ncbi:MAG TPA: hypothetical protein VHL14_03530 [Steroidobacteraceae bacterium]|nr:hypothetical protein [Steroidobacteraceae bacterium]
MRNTWILLLLGCGVAYGGEPLDVRAIVDVRIVNTDSEQSFVNGGFGRTRFDTDHDGLRLGAVYGTARYRVSDTVTLNGDVAGYADGNSSALDVTQLFAQWRPFPVGPIRFSSKIGMFYPEFSMENRGPAWTPVYSVTPAAINSWYGEELRTLGTELTARWLGASAGYQGDVALVLGAYGWNDPLGLTLTSHGWNLHDRQTGLTGHLITPGNRWEHIHEFREIDGRPGFYAGVQWRHGDHLEVRAYRYDNRGDPAAFKDVYGWLTRFDTIGARLEVDENWTVIGQWLQGDTFLGPRDSWGIAWDMKSWFLLLSRQVNTWRFSLRHDDFNLNQYKGAGFVHFYDDDGGAWTVAASKDVGTQWQFMAEWLSINSRFLPRASYTKTQLAEQQLQLSLRYKWHY